MLYAPPTKDKKMTQTQKSEKSMKNTVQKSNRQLNQTQMSQQHQPSQTLYEAEKRLVQDLSSISKSIDKLMF
jgi:hypothetical protein